MTEPLVDDALRLAVELARTIVQRIADDDLARPTPCESWDVEAVLNAMAVKAHLFADAVEGPKPAKPSPWPNLLGDDPSAAVTDALDALVAAYDEPVDSLIVLPLGTVPWATARQVATLDVTLHAWDLAVATGQDFDPAAGLVDDCLATTVMINDELRDRGEFKPTVQGHTDATPLQQLLTRAGRSPTWPR
jgi:uncharacterized protein (TIGR03086 family)